MTTGVLSAEQEAALKVAREMVRAGTPLFLARADEAASTGYRPPASWQRAEPDEGVVDAWCPGLALCAVTGVLVDLVDVDPRHGGAADSWLPDVVARSRTSSGGDHYWVPRIGVESRDGVYPGVDVKSGVSSGRGRGFGFLPPTVRRSRLTGREVPYVWLSRPDDAQEWAELAASGAHSVGLLRGRVLDLRSRAQTTPEQPRTIARSAAAREWAAACARLTEDVRRWAATGWGGQAHAGLLAHSTHLARLSPDHAEVAYLAAFAAAGVEPDGDDLAKLESALAAAAPDRVVPDEELSDTGRFWAGGAFDGPKSTAPPPEQPGGRGGFRFLTEDELDQLPTPEPLIAGLLWQNTLARLFGASGAGKTFLALDLGAHVARAQPWQGREVKGGAVVYVAGEGAPSIGPRLRAWRSWEVDGAVRGPTGLLVWPEPVQIGGPSWVEFVTACAASGVVLVVLDTQAAMSVGRRENDNDDAGEVAAAANQLRADTGACVLLVHHTGWAEEGRARGASALFAALDTELQVAEVAGGRISLTQRKQRYAERGPSISLRLVRHDGALVVATEAEEGRGHFGVSDVDRRAALLVKRLEAYRAAGGEYRLTNRSIKPVVKVELGIRVDDRVVERAVRMLKAAAGMPVNLTDGDGLDDVE